VKCERTLPQGHIIRQENLTGYFYLVKVHKREYSVAGFSLVKKPCDGKISKMVDKIEFHPGH